MQTTVLCILDGWGIAESGPFNAISYAKTPNYDRFLEIYPNALLKASGKDVGLPDGVMGNSEVSHIAIGSGRIIVQDLPRIDNAISDGFLEQEIKNICKKIKNSKGRFHIMGLLSEGGVHSHQRHIEACVKYSADVSVFIHVFLDGRDTPPKSAIGFLKNFNKAIENYENAKIATVSGRYYAMDRDKNWDRILLAYNAIKYAKGLNASTAIEAIEKEYALERTDEFIFPTVINDYSGMRDGDGLLMVNYRADRARQILTALLDSENHLNEKPINFSAAHGMTEYSEHLLKLAKPIFSKQSLNFGLAEVISNNKMTQLHIAETEKYAHVTYYFNGCKEELFEGENRILIQSPKVPTYDLMPEMSAFEITEKACEAISNYDFIVINFANSDMVGHTGNMNATVKAIEIIDECLGKIEEIVKKSGSQMLIIGDHGNAECMKELNEGAHTAHTINPVPIIGIGINNKIKNGNLSDVAPTILKIMNISAPKQMTGTCLINEN